MTKMLPLAELYIIKTLFRQRAQLRYQRAIQLRVKDNALRAGDAEVAMGAYGTVVALDALIKKTDEAVSENYQQLASTKEPTRIRLTYDQAKAELREEAEAEGPLEDGWGRHLLS